MDGQGCNRLCDWRNGGTLVVGELELFQVLSQKILAVDTSEIEVVEGRTAAPVRLSRSSMVSL